MFYLKQLNGTGEVIEMEKFLNPPCLHLIFDFYFLIILKLIYFIKNINIMNFYKLFIKKHYDYYYYLY